MIDRLMRWLGYVPLSTLRDLNAAHKRANDLQERLDEEIKRNAETLNRITFTHGAYRKTMQTKIDLLERLSKYAHVQKIIANMDKGTAKY